VVSVEESTGSAYTSHSHILERKVERKSLQLLS
jgi:hypothetical protein